MIVSQTVFLWFAAVMTAGMCGIWGFRDLYRLIKILRSGREAHDEIFGSIVGVSIGIIGFVGIFKFHFGL